MAARGRYFKRHLLCAALAALFTRAALLKQVPQALVSLQRTPAAPPNLARSGDVAPAWMAKVVPNMVFASIAAATAMATVGGKKSLLAGQSRPSRQVSCERAQQDVRQVPVHLENEEVSLAESAPKDLYELFGTASTADEKDIKKKYYDLQKLCHPDVAGPEGEEMCILLNDAWELLSDPEKRKDYDAQIELAKPANLMKIAPPVSTDLSPTWKGKRKTLKHHSDYTGIPLSHSRWSTVPPEDRGEKHAEEKMLFVDEWACICCRNCCDVAPQTFCIQNDNGRANVYTQWGNSEEYLDYAVAACPVDCIYWVSREELQVLEYVTAEKMVEEKGQLPCPLSFMQGMVSEPPRDPVSDANRFKAKREEDERRRELAQKGDATAKMEVWFQRILDVFENLSENLRRSVMLHMKK